MTEKGVEKELDNVVGGQTAADKSIPTSADDCLKAGSANPLYSTQKADNTVRRFKPDHKA